MRIYLSADIEGVAGVVSRDHLSPGGAEYELARRWMTNEVLAAIQGARMAGANEFVVSDSHGNGQNLLLDEFADDTTVVRSWPRPLQMMQGIETGPFAGAFLLGHHAGSQHRAGGLAHTMSSAVLHSVRLNGIEASEAFINAAIAGSFGVPTLLASGDSDFAEEASSFLSNAEIVTTKWSFTMLSARTLTPGAACRLIREAAERATSRAADIAPFQLPGPISVALTFKERLPAEVLGFWPGIVQTAARTVTFQAKDVKQAARMLFVAVGYDPKGR